MTDYCGNLRRSLNPEHSKKILDSTRNTVVFQVVFSDNPMVFCGKKLKIQVCFNKIIIFEKKYQWNDFLRNI